MWTFLKWALMVGLAVIIVVPLLKMGIDYAAQKFAPLAPIAAYTDKA